MLTSIRQVNEEFFRKFYGLKMPMGGVEKSVLCRYAKKSSHDYVEEQANQIYPCIVIQDYSPNPKKEWYIDMHAYFGGKSLDGLTGYLYQRPIWMEFRYDVSVVAKGYNDFISMQDYFMENFVYGRRFIFDAHLSGEDLVGDIVPYEVRGTDIPRTDGIFEKNYEFTCSVWLYPQKPEEVTLIQNIVIRSNAGRNRAYAITEDDKVLFDKDGEVIEASPEFEELLETVVISDDVDDIKVDIPDEEEKDDRTLYVKTEE